MVVNDTYQIESKAVGIRHGVVHQQNSAHRII